MPSDPFDALGEFLTANEALGLAVLLAEGEHTSVALREVSSARRDDAKGLLAATGLGHSDVDRSVAVLHAIAGAKSVHRDLTPVWTMPGNEATIGHLTSELRADLTDVDRAQGGIQSGRRGCNRLRRRRQG
jgi:hypothetical protein